MIRIARLSVLIAESLLQLASASAQSLDGVWRSQGYGDVYEIRGTTLRAFEVTTRTCVASFTAKQVSIPVPDREAAFKARGEDVLFISARSGEDHKVLNHPDSLSSLKIDRLPRMPTVCDPPTASTPIGNFEVFTRTFAEHYISFDLKQTDWEKVIADNRPKVTPQTTPAELFGIFEAMIKPLGDLHTGVGAPKLKRETEEFFRQGTDRIIKGGIDRFAHQGRRELFAITDHAYLHGSLRKFCNGQMQYGHIDKMTGYLRILSFDDCSKHGGFATSRIALDSALDEIFADPTLEALVIDVRLSFGGDDRYGLVIASRLATSEYLAYAIQARADPAEHDSWTVADRIFVQPSSRPGFRGPVVELIGAITMSGAETFSQALMGRTPRVTMIGENTQGVFCDTLDRRLPNGWTFSLPNAVYRTAEGTAFDVRGIPPDIGVAVFTDEDVASGTDPGMAMALRVLSKQR